MNPQQFFFDETKVPKEIEENAIYHGVAEKFIQEEFAGQKYNLFLPKGYDPADQNTKYPLVQFIHDASVCGSETKRAVIMCQGAIIWATDLVQKKYPCIVFAPQFDPMPIVDDDWNVDPRLTDCKKALDHVVSTYHVDRDRIYTTGESMGCMASIVLNVRYPDYFAASYLVAGQWDDRGIAGLEKQNLWMLCSQGDAKAFPIMNQMCVAMEQAGAKVVHRVWDAGLSQEEYRKIAEELIATGANVIHTPYRLETVANGWHSNGGEHHVGTWKTAYEIEAIHDWLFSKRKGE